MGEPAHDQYVTVRSPLVTRPMLSEGATSSIIVGPYLKKKNTSVDCDRGHPYDVVTTKMTTIIELVAPSDTIGHVTSGERTVTY